MRRPKRAHPMVVTDEEIKHLQRLIRAPHTPPAQVLRARIILTAHAHPEQNDQQIAMTVGTTASTVRTWRRRWDKTRSLANLPHR